MANKKLNNTKETNPTLNHLWRMSIGSSHHKDGMITYTTRDEIEAAKKVLKALEERGLYIPDAE